MNSDLIAFTTCIEYDDVFRQIIDSWIDLKFKKIIVVTGKHDSRTIELCNQYNLETIQIDYERPFRWGLYRNIALDYIKTGWVLGLDCDTYLPFKRKLMNGLISNRIYGLSHIMVNKAQLLNIKYGGKMNGRHFKKCMGPFQLFNLDHVNKNNIRYLEESTVVNGKGVDWHFARKLKCATLFDDVVYCLNLGDRDGRKLPRIQNPKNAMTILNKYKNSMNPIC